MLFAWVPDAGLSGILLGIILSLLAPFAPIVVGLLQEWWASRIRQQYCPHCGRAAPVLGCDTRCDRCGCEYDKLGRLIAEAPIRPNWSKLDLSPFNDRCDRSMQQDGRYR